MGSSSSKQDSGQAEALVSSTHPRCSVCPSAWKSTSCPFRSWPIAVLADITFTNLLKEPEGEAAWLITGPSGGLLGSAYHFPPVQHHLPVQRTQSFPRPHCPTPVTLHVTAKGFFSSVKSSNVSLQLKSLLVLPLFLEHNPDTVPRPGVTILAGSSCPISWAPLSPPCSHFLFPRGGLRSLPLFLWLVPSRLSHFLRETIPDGSF